MFRIKALSGVFGYFVRERLFMLISFLWKWSISSIGSRDGLKWLGVILKLAVSSKVFLNETDEHASKTQNKL